MTTRSFTPAGSNTEPFEPIFRTHGSRGTTRSGPTAKQAEPILEKYLKLRYQLMPYIYSLGYRTYQTGAPYMRALFMDFPDDAKVADLGDEYMFGPAFLVAPVTEQGATSRMVYLPAGTDWYNYWTNERLPAARRSGWMRPSIRFRCLFAPGRSCRSGNPWRTPARYRSWPRFGCIPAPNGDFTLYQDDGKTYAYEKGTQQHHHAALG